MQVSVTPTMRGKHKLYRISYGPYNTLVQYEYIWDAKQHIQKLPLPACPMCGALKK